MNDTISREAVADAINGIECTRHTTWYEFYQKVMTAVEKLPPAEPKRGKWIKTARWGRVYYCNQCRNYLDFDGVNAGRGSTNFCPNCGADMRQKGESSESN